MGIIDINKRISLYRTWGTQDTNFGKCDIFGLYVTSSEAAINRTNLKKFTDCCHSLGQRVNRYCFFNTHPRNPWLQNQQCWVLCYFWSNPMHFLLVQHKTINKIWFLDCGKCFHLGIICSSDFLKRFFNTKSNRMVQSFDFFNVHNDSCLESNFPRVSSMNCFPETTGKEEGDR